MTISQVTVRTLAVLALMAGCAAVGFAQPAITPAWALQQNPRQPGVNVTTPPAAQCTVMPIPHPKDAKLLMGYVVRDAGGKPVRQFITYDSKNFNVVSYFVDGVEAYREVFPPDPKEPYQFRWLGPNGSKWGIDRNRDGKIDEWVAISPEEVSQELVAAVANRDLERLRALLVTPEHLSAVGLPLTEADKVKARAAAAARKLADAADMLKLSPQAKWVHVEFGPPQTRPADAFEGRDDWTVHKNGMILIEDGGKTHFLQTGELVQIGRAWKVIDGPTAGPNHAATSGPETPIVLPQIEKLVTQLNDLDKQAPAQPTVANLAAFNARRAELLEQIVAGVPPDKVEAKETWAKMLIDAHTAAAEGDGPGNKHLVRVKQWRDVMAQPGGNLTLAAYAAFRFLVADNSAALRTCKPDEYGPIQDKWRAGLEDYLKTYPKSADAPEAALRLAMAWELSGLKDGETKAKEWFEYLQKNHADHPYATKAAGALKRLDSEGKPLELTGPLLHTGQPFDAAQKDKVVVVYYWASWSHALPEDAKKLQSLIKDYEAKGLVIVTVGLDHDARTASEAIQRVGLPGTHLYAPGGLDASPLAASYGVMVAPHVLIAGKDGKILNRNAQVATLEEDIKKALEK